MDDYENLPDFFRSAIDEIGRDSHSGASEILRRAVALLELADAVQVVPVATAICAAQPSMASLWNAALAAIASIEDPARLPAFTARLERADRAIERYASAHFASGEDARRFRVVTLSFSSTVSRLLPGLSRSHRVEAACAEGRPACEGRRMATDLAAAGIPVTFYTDAAIAQALSEADAVMVGADAVAPSGVVNKSGTRQLAAAALHQGVPVYVVASGDKFVSSALAAHLQIRQGRADEVWPAPAEGVSVRNVYFETTPLDLVTSLITDRGVIAADSVPQVCASPADEKWLPLLLRGSP